MSEQERGPGWVAAARASAVLLVAGSLLAGCASGSSPSGGTSSEFSGGSIPSASSGCADAEASPTDIQQ